MAMARLFHAIPVPHQTQDYGLEVNYSCFLFFFCFSASLKKMKPALERSLTYKCVIRCAECALRNLHAPPFVKKRGCKRDEEGSVIRLVLPFGSLLALNRTQRGS